MHSPFIVLCVSVRWTLCKIPFASILSKSAIQNCCCMPCCFFSSSLLLRCTMLNPVLVSQGVNCPWCSAHRLELLSSLERDAFWRETEGEIITEIEMRSINKNSVMSYRDTSSYHGGFIGPVLLIFLFQWGSKIVLYGVQKGSAVVFENCTPQTDRWEYLGNIDSWVTTNKLCWYKLFSMCSE